MNIKEKRAGAWRIRWDADTTPEPPIVKRSPLQLVGLVLFAGLVLLVGFVALISP